MTPGRAYCLASWIRGSAGTRPFLGINSSYAAGAPGAEHWLIGNSAGFTKGLGAGDTVTVVTSDGNWGLYTKAFTMPAGYTHVVVKAELWGGGGAGTADFDFIQLVEGPCPTPSPLAVLCAPSFCGSSACPDRQTLCTNACADFRSDPSHCGRCAGACPPGQVCASGSCLVPSS